MEELNNREKEIVAQNGKIIFEKDPSLTKIDIKITNLEKTLQFVKNFIIIEFIK